MRTRSISMVLGLLFFCWGTAFAQSPPPASFAAAVNYPVGTEPRTVAVGDFNGDGKLDLAVANEGSNNVSVLLGKGDGTFQTAVNYAVGSTPASVAGGDFNGDGKLDLAVANREQQRERAPRQWRRHLPDGSELRRGQ